MRKRLTASIGIAAALLSMTACRSSPQVAAYAGDATITEQRVTDVQDGTIVTLDNGTKTAPIGREKVVETLVLHKICSDRLAKQAAANQPFKPADVPAQGLVEGELPASMKPAPPAPTSDQSPEDVQKLQEQAQKDQAKWEQSIVGSEYVKLRSEALGCAYGASVSMTGPPTEAELQELFDNAMAVNAFPAGTKFSDAAPKLAEDPQITQRLDLKRAVEKMVDESDVTINPRYGELSIPLLGTQTDVVLDVLLGESNEVVQER